MCLPVSLKISLKGFAPINPDMFLILLVGQRWALRLAGKEGTVTGSCMQEQGQLVMSDSQHWFLLAVISDVQFTR